MNDINLYRDLSLIYYKYQNKILKDTYFIKLTHFCEIGLKKLEFIINVLCWRYVSLNITCYLPYGRFTVYSNKLKIIYTGYGLQNKIVDKVHEVSL